MSDLPPRRFHELLDRLRVHQSCCVRPDKAVDLAHALDPVVAAMVAAVIQDVRAELGGSSYQMAGRIEAALARHEVRE